MTSSPSRDSSLSSPPTSSPATSSANASPNADVNASPIFGSGKVHSGAALRASFLDFFVDKGHERVKSAPLVPQGDQTLLFVNAGMVQFKDLFTGKETRTYKRATSSQKCVRAGGKHNDLENVGRTARHHTFFEMLGNFSFGDYFKEEACKLAWEYLTEVLRIPADRLTVTVFAGEDGLPCDDEAEKIWHEVVGVPKDRISRLGKADNFWSMGDTGPCGPCSEIHYDRGVVEGTFGGDDPEGDRVLEIWNLVFMQYDRDASGKLTPLPAPSVDTGMGLERLAMVMNGCASNYDTDLLRPLIAHVEKASKKIYGSTDGDDDVAMRVIADHARTTCFLIADGVFPGSDKRPYVLRSIMRRAIRFGSMLGFNELFFEAACMVAVENFEEAYPELREAASLIKRWVRTEEEAFRRTLDRGLELFAKATLDLKSGDTLPGDTAFELQATFGFPKDLTELMAKEKGLTLDHAAFGKLVEEHALVSTGALGVAGEKDLFKDIRSRVGASVFNGYDTNSGRGKVVALIRDDVEVKSLSEGDEGIAILDCTPMYGESGGQVGDTGSFKFGEGRAVVRDVGKKSDLHTHVVHIESGTLKIGDAVEVEVDGQRLRAIVRHHSATHLMHHALREVLGDHVSQKGSLVEPHRLRFDFSHFEAMTSDEIVDVENRVNDAILANVGRSAKSMSFDDAKGAGAMALFGEKYGDEVRVVTLGDSVELCGGIHVERTGDIGLFKITSETLLATGVRRIEAVTGLAALDYARKQAALVADVASQLKVSAAEVSSRVEKLRHDLKNAEQELLRLQQKESAAQAGQSAQAAKEVCGIKLLVERADNIDPKNLRDYADKLRDQLGSGVVVLGRAVGEKKCTLLVALTKDLKGKVHAGKLAGELAKAVDGRGGGKPDFAQAGGSDPSKLDAALAMAEALVAEQMGAAA